MADMLDHVLRKADGELVALETEVELVENYLELEKLRYDDRLSIQFNKSISGINLVPPLVFLSLVENAFKHGASQTEVDAFVAIDMTADGREVSVIVENSTGPKTGGNTGKKIGLENIKKQLELLYPGRFEFDVMCTTNSYEVNLVLRNS